MTKNKFVKLIIFFISLLIVAFSQPAWTLFFGYFAAFLGYTLFWLSISDLKKDSLKFLISFFWFFLVFIIQLSWMTSTKYQGNLILLVYFVLITIFALQFALISYFILKDKKITFLKILATASFYTIFEWLRLFILCGFTFNCIGEAYANNLYSLQFASIIGIYGLTFWILLTNLIGLKAILEKSIFFGFFWVFIGILPYCFGVFHLNIYENKYSKANKFRVLLVQTALLPEQKILTKNYFDQFVSPIIQWKKIINLIEMNNSKKVDLIVFPEVCVPFLARDPFYPYESVKKLFLQKYGNNVISKLAPLKLPYAVQQDNIWYVSNSFFAKSISNIYDAEVVIGFEDLEEETNKAFNAAFYFQPKEESFQRYEKQILVPIGEYIPFKWLEKLALERYGISSSFTQGNTNKIFSKNKYSFSICYEETFPNIMRNAKRLGASCFINLTNDAYFYNSKLYKQHYYLAKIRAVENGSPLLRACNTGMTSAIDSFGRTLSVIESESVAKSIVCSLPFFSCKTLYSFWGNYFILSFSAFFILIFLIFYKKEQIKD